MASAVERDSRAIAGLGTADCRLQASFRHRSGSLPWVGATPGPAPWPIGPGEIMLPRMVHPSPVDEPGRTTAPVPGRGTGDSPEVYW